MSLGIVPTLIGYFLFFVWVAFSCILNDPSENILANFFVNKLPRIIFGLIQKILGPKAVTKLTILTDHALLLLYLVIVLGSWSVMFTYGYRFIERSPHVPDWHKYSGYLVFVACMSSWFKAHGTSPGNITERTMIRYDNYQYDGLLFVNKACPTLGIRKLPRSKYEQGRHIPRFDHYCGWISASVGEENYRFFLLFVVVHLAMCLYGTIVCYRLFRGEIIDKDLLNAVFFNGETGDQFKADKYIVAHFLFMKHFPLSFVFILMAVMVLLLSLFLTFHIYITANGMTTNEFYKWRRVRKLYQREKSRFEKAMKDGKIVSKNQRTDPNFEPMPDADVGCIGPSGGSLNMNINMDTKNDSDSTIIDPGPMPSNIYNLGFIENFKEVFYPRSLRADAIARYKASLCDDQQRIKIDDRMQMQKTKAT